MLFHDEVVDCSEDQDDNHDDCLGCASEVILSIPNEEEEANQRYFRDIDSSEELRQCVVEEEAVGVNLVALDIIIVMTVSEPEE